MRRGIGTFVLGVTVGSVACAGVTSGVLASGGEALAGAARALTTAPAAVADGLPGFEDCEQLRRWYVRTALPEVGPWGLAGSSMLVPGPMLDTMTRTSPTAASAGDAVGTSGTGTNVQDDDVDEADVAKTDGRILVRVSDGTLVVTDVSGARPRELSRTPVAGPFAGRLAGSFLNAELLLHESRVVVVVDEASELPATSFPQPGTMQRRLLPQPPRPSRTRLVSFDLADPSAPRLTDDRSLDGVAVSTRQYADGTVRVVLRADSPRLDFVHPDRDRTLAEATRLNRRIVRSSPIEAWLPTVRPRSGAGTPLLACSEVRHPVRPSGPGTLSVVSFPFDAPDRFSATAVLTSGDLVYSSTDRLYVATTGDRTTVVHAFSLDGGRTAYVGSGSVSGTVKDRWSLDAYDGRLRVATTDARSSASTRPARAPASAVTVLEERGGRLVQTGRVDGLGPDEELKAVRWFGDLAVVVTFRSTDPLFTLDLADPEHPRVVGELKAPGYSSYLHPVGDGLVVGVGHDATTAGVDRGAQLATFDLRDLSAVRRTDTLGLGRDSEVGAEHDARAFVLIPGLRTLLTTVESWRTGRSRFVAVQVAPDGRLTGTGSWATRSFSASQVRALPLGGGRVALVDDTVRLVRVG